MGGCILLDGRLSRFLPTTDENVDQRRQAALSQMETGFVENGQTLALVPFHSTFLLEICGFVWRKWPSLFLVWRTCPVSQVILLASVVLEQPNPLGKKRCLHVMDLVSSLRCAILHACASVSYSLLPFQKQILAHHWLDVVVLWDYLHNRDFEERFQCELFHLQRHLLDKVLRKALGPSPSLFNGPNLWM